VEKLNNHAYGDIITRRGISTKEKESALCKMLISDIDKDIEKKGDEGGNSCPYLMGKKWMKKTVGGKGAKRLKSLG